MRVHKQKLDLSAKQKLTILLEVMGKYLTSEIRKDNVYANWVAGDVIFNWFMDTIHVDKTETYSIFLIPDSPDDWHIKIIHRRTTMYNEDLNETIFDKSFTNDLDEMVDSFVSSVPFWWKFFDRLEHICKTRLDINPKFKTKETEMRKRGELPQKPKYSTDNKHKFNKVYYHA